jgi:hypothetical protein
VCCCSDASAKAAVHYFNPRLVCHQDLADRSDDGVLAQLTKIRPEHRGQPDKLRVTTDFPLCHSHFIPPRVPRALHRDAARHGYQPGHEGTGRPGLNVRSPENMYLPSWLTSSRWTYLEKNVNNVMTKLQEGLDMKTYMYEQPNPLCLPNGTNLT